MAISAESLRRSLCRTSKRLGVHIDELLGVYEEQEGKCKICKEASDRRQGGLVADFDYSGNAGLRGFLCFKCKALLSHANESVERLKAAIDYLSASL